MNRVRKFFVILAFVLSGCACAYSHDYSSDMCRLISYAVKLRDMSADDNVRLLLEQDNTWTLMNEVDDDLSGGQCSYGDEIGWFGINDLAMKVEGKIKARYKCAGVFCNGTDPRYDYSFIEKSVKQSHSVSYRIPGRSGKQQFVIVPFDGNADLSITAFSGGNSIFFQKDTDGNYFTSLDVPEGDDVTIKVVDNGPSVAFVIFNHFFRDPLENASGRLLDYSHSAESVFSSGENAYLENDIASLKNSIQKYKAIDKSGWSESELLSSEAHIHKLQGDLDYCLSDYSDSLFAASLQHYKAALDILSGNRGISAKNSYDAAVIQLEIAQLLYKQRLYSEALPYLCYAKSVLPSALGPYSLCLAQTSTTADGFNDALNCIVKEILSSRGAACWENRRKRAKILTLRNEAGFGDLKEADSIYRSYFAYQKDSVIEPLFSKMSEGEREAYWMRNRQFAVDCYRLEGEDPGLLYDVSLFCKSLLLRYSSRFKDFEDRKWRDVQKNLPRRGCAVEFLQYMKGDNVKLAALVLRKHGDHPEFIELGSLSALSNIEVGEYGDSPVSVKDALESDDEPKINMLYRCDSVKRFIWNEKLMEAVRQSRDVYFSPDGILHQIAIEYLAPRNSGLRLHRVTSTRSLGLRGRSWLSGRALLFGDLKFNRQRKQNADFRENDSNAYRELSKGRFRLSDDGSWRDVYAIGEMCSRKGNSVALFTGESVDEKVFADSVKGKSMLFISTHGYLCGNLDAAFNELKPVARDESLSKNIILLSDCMANLHSKGFSPNDGSDGFLSAREISSMDMSSVSLCCLALCMGGAGEVTADGVYGIQRGLKNAGVGAMVLSLWSVNNRATEILMRDFYANLCKGKSYCDAFTAARQSLVEDGLDPYYTDAFVMIDSGN